ncbi:hypothetical protein BDF14DRAFT_27665 [Spinellus fusiger]|nr:hypothetical protein BDF14DRAFT_27665 [Spinellus fusiger]
MGRCIGGVVIFLYQGQWKQKKPHLIYLQSLALVCIMPITKRVHLKDWQYLSIKIWSEEGLVVNMTELSLRMTIHQALQTNFGIVGASSPITVLDWDEVAHTGIIKVMQSELVAVWSALVNHQFLITGQPCAFEIISSSAHLISLANNSRSSQL